jgi:hypothetical protein
MRVGQGTVADKVFFEDPEFAFEYSIVKEACWKKFWENSINQLA